MATTETEPFSSYSADQEREKREVDAAPTLAEKSQAVESQPFAAPSRQDDDRKQYLSGVKLILLLGAMTVPMFLVLLDMSIIATVCIRSYSILESPRFLVLWLITAQTLFRQSLESLVTSTLCKT
jgi:hypothetical protein